MTFSEKLREYEVASDRYDRAVVELKEATIALAVAYDAFANDLRVDEVIG